MSEEEQLIDFARKWDEAMVRNIAEEISQFMSDDWVIVGTEGGVTTKTEFLSWISSGDLTHNRMDSDQLHVKLHDDSAVVISCGTSAGHYRAKAFSFYEWSMSVFVKQSNGWICVSTMLTPAQTEK